MHLVKNIQKNPYIQKQSQYTLVDPEGKFKSRNHLWIHLWYLNHASFIPTFDKINQIRQNKQITQLSTVRCLLTFGICRIKSHREFLF